MDTDGYRNFLYLLLIVLTACTPVPDKPVAPAPESPEGFPFDLYREARARGEPVYGIDSANSIAVIRVYRDGRLAHLGHDHVVASRDMAGFSSGPGNLERAVPTSMSRWKN